MRAEDPRLVCLPEPAWQHRQGSGTIHPRLAAGQHVAVRVLRGRRLSGAASRALVATTDPGLEYPSGRTARFDDARYQLTTPPGVGRGAVRTAHPSLAAG